MSVHYLATPYTRYPHGIERACADAAALAGRLLKAGVTVYCPVAHGHTISQHSGIDPLDLTIWLPFNDAMLDAASSLIVAEMDGWQESQGVKYEIDKFEKAGKPIFMLSPETLSMRRRGL
jgi:hypothetical protein